MYPEKKLKIVPECNDEDDNPTCWAIEGGDEKTCGKHFVWICRYVENEYVVEDSIGRDLAGKTYKTLRGAKKAAEGIIWRQDESGAYSD